MDKRFIHAEGSYFDEPYRPLLNDPSWTGVHVGRFCVIGENVRLGDRVIIGHGSIVEDDVEIGDGALLCYRAQICSESKIGSGSIIGGFVGERSRVGRNCRVFGFLVHSHPRHFGGWDDDSEMKDGPVIDDSVVIGFGAVIVGAVRLGKGAYIGANSTVRRDVKEFETVGPNSVVV